MTAAHPNFNAWGWKADLIEATEKPQKSMKPRIIIHGGAGNVTPEHVPTEKQIAYRKSLLRILRSGQQLLDDGHHAVDVATHVVALFEDDELFNAGKGAVFTRAGTNELEASIMVSRGFRKRGVGCMRLTRVKNPIKLAKEMLVRGEDEDGKGGGAYMHSQLAGEQMEALADQWGLDMVNQSYFFTQQRWDEHERGLRRERNGDYQHKATIVGDIDVSSHETLIGNDQSWKSREALPQGTVGAVVLDSSGTLCAATSTGGLTNKVPGRIGDTPTLGAGFWAEEWDDHPRDIELNSNIARTGMRALLQNCIPLLSRKSCNAYAASHSKSTHAVAMSGTGNGDSFLRVNAVRTVGAMVRFEGPSRQTTLAEAITRVAGPGGELQQSAEDRWGNGEGEGGVIGIELANGESSIAWNFNCGGMFRAWVDDEGQERAMIFRDK